jgi:predicted TIM-barrel fold metal-dependent hydrolase
MSTATGIVDAHHHVWDLSARGQDWITGKRMAPLARSFTVCRLAASYTEVIDTARILSEWEQAFSGTATRTYRLPARDTTCA